MDPGEEIDPETEIKARACDRAYSAVIIEVLDGAAALPGERARPLLCETLEEAPWMWNAEFMHNLGMRYVKGVRCGCTCEHGYTCRTAQWDV